jgi:hypothetical protein
LFVGGGSSLTSTTKTVKFDLSKIKIWNADDVELPKFDELTHAEIGKWAIFKVKISISCSLKFVFLHRKQTKILIFILLLNYKLFRKIKPVMIID